MWTWCLAASAHRLARPPRTKTIRFAAHIRWPCWRRLFKHFALIARLTSSLNLRCKNKTQKCKNRVWRGGRLCHIRFVTGRPARRTPILRRLHCLFLCITPGASRVQAVCLPSGDTSARLVGCAERAVTNAEALFSEPRRAACACIQTAMYLTHSKKAAEDQTQQETLDATGCGRIENEVFRRCIS